MTTIKQLYDWVAGQGHGVTVAEAAAALGDTDEAIQQLLEDSSTSTTPAFEYDPLTAAYVAV